MWTMRLRICPNIRHNSYLNCCLCLNKRHHWMHSLQCRFRCHPNLWSLRCWLDTKHWFNSLPRMLSSYSFMWTNMANICWWILLEHNSFRLMPSQCRFMHIRCCFNSHLRMQHWILFKCCRCLCIRSIR